MQVKIYSETGDIPVYQTQGAAAFDIRATKATTLSPGTTNFVPTGIYVEIPEGYFLAIVIRSGIAAKTQIRLANNFGVIDSK